MALDQPAQTIRLCACGAASCCCARATGCAAWPTTRRGSRSPATATRPTCRAGRASRSTGRLLIYPEQADIESDAALRDTLMLARGVDAVVQCAPRLAELLDRPTIDRGAALDGLCRSSAAAQPAASAGLDARFPAAACRDAARGEPSPRIGWFSQADPPAGLDIERNPDELTRCRFVVGDDAWPAHLAARLGIPTIILLPRLADWLWGPGLGPSPWYPSVELLAADDAEVLVSKLSSHPPHFLRGRVGRGQAILGGLRSFRSENP